MPELRSSPSNSPEVSLRGVPLYRQGFVVTFIVLSVLALLNVFKSRSWNFQGPQISIRNAPWEWAEDNVRQAEKGIVMCVGDDESLISDALYTIHRIRVSFKSPVHIAIAHCSELTSDTMRRLQEFGNVTIQNICSQLRSSKQKIRLRGWFCKTQALILSNFNETMLVDADAIFFDDPTKLFSSKEYLEHGALFFRDRMLYESPTERDGLHYEDVVSFIAEESYGAVNVTPSIAKDLFTKSGHNYFWLHGINGSHYKPFRHVQESSVVVFNKNKLPKTLLVLKRLLPRFTLGESIQKTI
jgi:hypothetical protein